MSDETLSVVAIISLVASALALWSSIRRRQLMRRVLRSLEKRSSSPAEPTGQHAPLQRVRTPPNIVDALARVTEELDTARRLLDEVYAIGLWSKSDDSSDNRRKRQGLREADWAVSGALRALTELRSHEPGQPVPLNTLENELRTLVRVLEPLPDTVTDTMGDSGNLDSAIGESSTKVLALLKMASELAAEYRLRPSEMASPSQSEPC
jgi:hypothetical protein